MYNKYYLLSYTGWNMLSWARELEVKWEEKVNEEDYKAIMEDNVYAGQYGGRYVKYVNWQYNRK